MYALLVLYITRVVHYLAGVREKVGIYAIPVLCFAKLGLKAPLRLVPYSKERRW